MALGLQVLFAFAFVCLVYAQTTTLPTSTPMPPSCEQVNGAWLINASCTDPVYSNVTILAETNETVPVAHRRVSGKVGTTDFNIYLPAHTVWRSRFFQTTYPTQSAVASAEQIAFAAASGAGVIQATGLSGYRVEAAAAKFAKTVAATFYGSNAKVFAFLSGGSGGSYPTIGAMENTNGVWDGYVPFIVGSPVALPYSFFARAYARFVLGDKAAMIADAVLPGGSGDPYAGLNVLETQVFDEVLNLGIPLGGWAGPAYLLGATRNNLGETNENLLGFGDNVRSLDPSYMSDFWSKPGYLGVVNSPLGDYFRQGRVLANATVSTVQRNNIGVVTSITLSGLPRITRPWIATDYSVVNGTSLVAIQGTLNVSTSVFTLGTNATSILELLIKGATVVVDNSWSLALMAYSRAQTPAAADFYTYDQYRYANGTVKYPTRFLNLGQILASSISGTAAYSGNTNGKVIIIDNLLDVDAPPTNADWYAKRVKSALGASFNDNFRLWYFENADHVGSDPTRLIPPLGVLEQAFRDVAAWAQNGTVPAQSTIYTVSNTSQIVVGTDPHSRGGIQPSVQLTVGDKDVITVAVGEPVTFKLATQAAADGSFVVTVAWDFTGSGTYVAGPLQRTGKDASAEATYNYTAPGVYFVGVLVAADREGDTDDRFAQVPNLDRVRVIVTSAGQTTTAPGIFSVVVGVALALCSL